MLQHSPFKVGEPAFLYFWQVPITKKYPLPKYYIGEVVLHLIQTRGGEILHPVTVIGISWSGIDWEYGIDFPEDHPQFEPEDVERDWVEEWQLEAI